MVVAVQEGIERDGDVRRVSVLEKNVHREPGC